MNTDPETLQPAKPGSSLLVHAVLLFASAAIGYVTINSIQDRDRQSLPLAEVDPAPAQIAAGTAPPAQSGADSVTIAEPISARNFEKRMQEIQTLDSKRQIAWEIESFFNTLTKEEAPGMHALLKRHPKYNAYAALLFQNWGALDPHAALAATETLEEPWKTLITKPVFQGWAKKDVHAAWEAASGFLSDKDGNKRNIGRPVMKEMIVQDPDFLLAIVNADTMHSLNSSIRSQMIDHAFESGRPEGMLQKLSDIANLQVRNEWTHRLFEQWAENSVDDALVHLDQFPNVNEANAAMEGLLRGWSKADPQAALEYALSHQADTPVKKATASILNEYVRDKSADDIGALVATMTSADSLRELGPSLAQALARHQPAEALKLLEQLEKSEKNQPIADHALRNWARLDLDAAQSYFMQLDPAARALHLSSMVDTLPLRPDGGEKLSELMNSVPAGEERSAILNSLVERSPYILNAGKADFLKALKDIALQTPGLTEANRKLLSSPAFEF